MISLSQVHPWKEILQELEKEEDSEKEKQEEGEEEEEKKEEKYMEKEEEEPFTSGDNDLHDIPDNLLTKLLAIEMETLDTEKERINQETQPGTEGEIFIMR